VDSRKGVPFGGFNRFVDIAPHFPGQKFPQTPNFGGVDRLSQTKLAKY